MIKFVKKRVKMFLRKMRRMLRTIMKIMKRLIIMLLQTSQLRLNCKTHFNLYKSTKSCDIPETKMLIVLSKHSTITLYFFAHIVALKTFSNIECYKNVYDCFDISSKAQSLSYKPIIFHFLSGIPYLECSKRFTLMHIYKNIS